MDNIQGMALIGSTVYFSRTPARRTGTPGTAIRIFSTFGDDLGHFSTTTTSRSPFAILGSRGELLVPSSAADDHIRPYSPAGGSLGTFHTTTSLNFARQMAIAANGILVAAGFSSNNVARLKP